MRKRLTIKRARLTASLYEDRKSVKLTVPEFKAKLEGTFKYNFQEGSAQIEFWNFYDYLYKDKVYDVSFIGKISFKDGTWSWQLPNFTHSSHNVVKVVTKDVNDKNDDFLNKAIGEKIQNDVLNEWKSFARSNSIIKKVMEKVISGYKIFSQKKELFEIDRDEYFSKLRVPAGFKLQKDGEVNERRYNYILKSEGIGIYIYVGDYEEWNKGKITFGGTIEFEANGKRYNLDRHGISDSFYSHSKEFPDINVFIASQIKRAQDEIKKKEDFDKKALTIPDIGYRITPEKKEEVTKLLKSGKSYTFNPRGMGTAYELSSKKKSKYDKSGSRQLAEFFDVQQIYISNVDWD